LHNQKHILGRKGEEIALSHLVNLGYKIEAKNYRCPFGEIDIIARDKEVLTFVEVKTRSSEKFGSPKEAVDYRKQQRLNRIAHYYLACSDKKGSSDMCRFDVVSVSQNPHAGWMIELIKDAFPVIQLNP